MSRSPGLLCFSVSANTALTLSETLSIYAVCVSVYVFCVISNDACPNKYCLTFAGIPASSNLVAYVWRSVCSVILMSSPFAIFSNAFFAALYVHGNKFSVCISFSSRQISAGIGIIRLPASDLGVSCTILFPLINATFLFIVSLQFSKSISAFVKASASPRS